MEHTKWEYKIWCGHAPDELLYMTTQGANGWELCHVTNPTVIDSSHRTSCTYYWKRPIQDNNSKEQGG